MATGQAPGNPIPAVRTYPPVEHPVVVIGPQYLAQYPVELAVSTKLWTLGENDFKVSDINGTLIFQVKSKLLTLHDRRFLKDAAGNTLVNLRQKVCLIALSFAFFFFNLTITTMINSKFGCLLHETRYDSFNINIEDYYYFLNVI
jgi:uncharacterized protein YxjI